MEQSFREAVLCHRRVLNRVEWVLADKDLGRDCSAPVDPSIIQANVRHDPQLSLFPSSHAQRASRGAQPQCLICSHMQGTKSPPGRAQCSRRGEEEGFAQEQGEEGEGCSLPRL